MHIINPPFTLAAALRESLPVVMTALREPTGASWDVSHGG
jgi:23S rRNA A2030 N6-methylase RlmJ